MKPHDDQLQGNAVVRRDLTGPWDHPDLGRLQSRVVMSAMTRSSSGPGHVPTRQMADYYARRAAAGVGMILTESTAIVPAADGFPDAPRIITAAQIEGWRSVTTAVHSAHAPIFCQLLHAGRVTHEDYTDGAQPVSATDRRASGINRRNGKPYALPRRLEAREVPDVIESFRTAAAAARSAGFDGVQLHLAHGYLPDQFLDAHVNDREDAYGGSVPNRCRFALELVEAVVADLGSERVSARISPSRWMDGLYEWPDMIEMLEYLLPALDRVGLRSLDISCARSDYHQTAGRVVRLARPRWRHQLMGGASLALEAAQAELDAGWLDMVTFGRALIANPDLVMRFRSGRALAAFEPAMLESLD